MLTLLKVQNLAVVENAEVAFAPGLNVITGETGSGKSVLIGALNLILGERADHGAIRNGTPHLSVEALFSLVDSPEVDQILADAGLPPCEDGQLVVRRLVAANGTGRCWINDAPSTAGTLRKIGVHLVDMHGPYDHQSLLSPDFQLALLDAFGHHDSGKTAYRACYDTLCALRSEREALCAESGEDIEGEIDRLRYIIDEIDTAALTEEDGDSLVERHAIAANSTEILELGNAILGGLSDGESSVFDSLASIQQQLGELCRLLPEAADWRDEAREATVQIQDLVQTMEDRLHRVEADPALLEQLEERMALVQRLKRKYGTTLEEIAAYRDARKAKLDRLLSRGDRLASLGGEIAQAEKAVQEAGAKLTAIREGAAATLGKAITDELRELGFAQSFFQVLVTPRPPCPSGADIITFSFAPNPGEPPMPLREIASSGEIARVMLATKSVLAEHDRIPLLVFDEIDSNIGGEIGRAVGRKLLQLAKTHQVISITHLPQVAAFGQAHLSVAKHVENNRTHTEITPLSDEARALELARMLGGSELTSVVLEHARELLATSSKAD